MHPGTDLSLLRQAAFITGFLQRHVVWGGVNKKSNKWSTGLIPRYHWDYGLPELLQAMKASFSDTREDPTIPLPGVGDCFPVRSGRAALVAALRALDLPQGARIGLPLYCCPVVFETVAAAGYHTTFIDVEESTFCMSASDLETKAKNLSAIIVVHMFGAIANIYAIRSAAGNLPLIEDCAQALGSMTEGQTVGTLGDISFFSFRCGKYISAGEGGALFSGNEAYRRKLQCILSEFPSSSIADELFHPLTTAGKAIFYHRPAYGLIGFPLGRILDSRLNLSAKSGVQIGKIRKSDLAIAKMHLKTVVRRIQKQREYAKYYCRALRLEPRMLPFEKPDNFYNRYQFPIVFDSQLQRDKMADFLFSRGIDTARYLDEVVDVASDQYGYQGDCPVAEQLSKRTLIIPNTYSLKLRDIMRITEAVNTGWTLICKTIAS